jgi:hypothetical protein
MKSTPASFSLLESIIYQIGLTEATLDQPISIDNANFN